MAERLATRYQIANGEAAQPVCAKDGRQLCFIAAGGKRMSVEIAETAGGLRVGSPRARFQTNIIQVFEACT